MNPVTALRTPPPQLRLQIALVPDEARARRTRARVVAILLGVAGRAPGPEGEAPLIDAPPDPTPRPKNEP